MKFIAEQGAPNIPIELLEAHQKNELVLFCGAGISYPLGLCGFEKLVEQVYKENNEQQNELEEEAFKRKAYDQVLNLLEKRIGNNRVRQSIIKTLSLEDVVDHNLQTHESILELSRLNKNNFRLVTTNIDLGFQLALEKIGLKSNDHIDFAPKLPIPKKHRWRSIVHLHGIINKNTDPDGKEIVFTSGDFGSAYLIERWASKFVAEMLKNFTVLFVGYSLEDPVLRYITDAIAAEMKYGNTHFKQAYVLAPTMHEDLIDKSKLNEWKAKGIQPILYFAGNNHYYLHDTLNKWAVYIKDSLSTIENLIKTNAQKPPFKPYNEYVEQIIDVFKSDEKTTQYSSKVFSKLANPPAPIEWLELLREHKLITLSQYSCFWSWLIENHLENTNLVEWVINHPDELHPTIKNCIKTKIKNDNIQEPYLTIWKIILSNNWVKKLDHTKDYSIVDGLINRSPNYQYSELIELIQPRFYFSENFLPQHVPNKQFEINIATSLSYHAYQLLKNSTEYLEKCIDLLIPLTAALNEALKMFISVNPEKSVDANCFIEMLELQYKYEEYSWVVLIKLSRILWKIAEQKDPSLAHAIVMLWKSLPYQPFRKLILYAYTISDITTPDSALEYLIEDDGLWDDTVKREKFRLLNKIWPKMSDDAYNKLITLALQGPNLEQHPCTLLNESQRAAYKDEVIMILLSKLESFDRALPAHAKTILTELSHKRPEFQLSENEDDEFNFKFTITSGPLTDKSTEDLLSLRTEQLIEVLAKENLYSSGRLYIFQQICKNHADKAIDVFKYMNSTQKYYISIINNILIGLSQNADPRWKETVDLLKSMHINILKEILLNAAWYINRASDKIQTSSLDEQLFWDISTRLLSLVDNEVRDTNKGSKEWVNDAINHPVGLITQSFLGRLSKSNLSHGEKLSGPCLDFINYLMQENNAAFIYARVILASRLQYFYSIDKEWTKKYLLPAFDWHTKNACAIFQGYLSSPWIDIELAADLKIYLQTAVAKRDKLSRYNRQLYQLLTVIFLQYPEIYSYSEKKNALRLIGQVDSRHIASSIWISMKNSQDENDSYWDNRIAPFIINAWPSDEDYISHKCSYYFSLTLIQLNKSFPEAIKIISPKLCYLDPCDFYQFLFDLVEKENKLPESFPQELLALMCKLYDFSAKEYSIIVGYLPIIADRALKADPSLISNPCYLKIRDYIKMNG